MFGFGNKPVIDYIVVGLGNPDQKYERTRHNAGFIVIDKLASEYNCTVSKSKFNAHVGECYIETKRCLLMKPQTYMNNSGQAVVQAMNFYKVPIEKVIVIYDDISLEPSSIRIRRKGTHGGHNGIKSIINLCGDENFPRVKVGVGKKPHPDYDLANWVLSSFSNNELKLIDDASENSIKAIKLIVNDDINAAMNLFN